MNTRPSVYCNTGPNVSLTHAHTVPPSSATTGTPPSRAPSVYSSRKRVALSPPAPTMSTPRSCAARLGAARSGDTSPRRGGGLKLVHAGNPGEPLTTSSAASGWYPDPSGAPGQRYFDGTQWTEHRSDVPAHYGLSREERADRLDAVIAEYLRYGGGRLESRSSYHAVIAYENKPLTPSPCPAGQLPEPTLAIGAKGAFGVFLALP